MPDYKESVISGNSWQRCPQIVIDNPRGGSPYVRFDEEVVLAVNGQEVRRPVGTIVVPFDPAREINLLDPTTGLPTGTSATYGDAYALLYSAYIDAAIARDVANLPLED